MSSSVLQAQQNHELSRPETPKSGQQSPISILPPEIISRIFLFCLSHPPSLLVFSEFQVGYYTGPDYIRPIQFRILGAICHQWRQIARATPELWDVISWHLDHRFDIPSRAAFFKDWLERSGKLPLYVRIHYQESLQPDEAASVQNLIPLIHALNAHSARLRVLVLCVPYSLVAHIRCPSSEDTPALESFSFHPAKVSNQVDWDVQNEAVSFSLGTASKPYLKRFHVWSFSLKRMDVNWDNITFFDAILLQVDDALDLLRQAPRMSYFSLEHIDNDPDISSPSTHVIHMGLREFNLGPSVDTFWSYLTLPSLKHLSLSLTEHDILVERQTEFLLPFLSRSACVLDSLKISSGIEDSAIKLLEQTPSVKELSISSYEFVGPFFERLRRTAFEFSLNEESGGNDTFLPHLQVLEFEGTHHFSWSILPALISTYHPSHSNPDTSDRPLQRPLKSLHVKLTPPDDVQPTKDDKFIDKHTVLALLDLIKAGYAISVKDRKSRNLLAASGRHWGVVDDALGYDSSGDHYDDDDSYSEDADEDGSVGEVEVEQEVEASASEGAEEAKPLEPEDGTTSG